MVPFALPEGGCLDAELLELGHRGDNGLDLGKDESGLLGVARRAVDLAAGLSLGPEHMAADKPGN